jgi:ligand-binding SRPBCC domain-containing protein
MRPDCKACSVKVHILERSQRVDIPVQRAFDIYADTHNLEPMTPPWLHFRLTNEGPVTMEAGTLLDYALRLHGVPIRWTTRIETWSPPTGFVDTQLEGPYALWEHTHDFEADGEGATVIHDRVRYAIPLGPLGAIAHRLFVRRDLRRIFDYRAAAFSRLVVKEGLPVAE